MSVEKLAVAVRALVLARPGMHRQKDPRIGRVT